MAKKVFISYRRQDTAPAAGRLYDRFRILLRKRNVFLDVGAIDAGENFEHKIKAEIDASDAVLVLIGAKWLEVKQAGAQPRLFDEGDHVRAEVRTALKGRNLTLPLLVDGALMPRSELLPEDIREITKHNALPLRHESFDKDADQIARTVLGLKPGELLWEQQGAMGRKIWGALTGVFSAGVLLVAAALLHHALLKAPLAETIGEAQTWLLIIAVLFAGLISGGFYGTKRRA